MRNSTKQIVNKLLNKSKKQNFESSNSSLKSAFSFKNSNISKNSDNSNNSKVSTKSSSRNNGIDNRILQQIFEILKMRLYIESIMNFKDEVIKEIMNENIKLINFKEYDIKSINKFVDDLVDIIKEENKKLKQVKESKSSLSEKTNKQNLNESNEFSLNSIRRRTIQLTSNGYRPTSVVTQRRRTIEFFLERPKSQVKKEPMRFNLFEKSMKKNYSFYESNPYTSANKQNYDSEGLEEFRNKIIDEVQTK